MRRGFTLIELLVSIAIFSIIVSIVAYAFRYSLDISKFLKYRYLPDLQVLSKLRDSLNSTFFYVAINERKFKTEDKIFFYFYGRRNELTFVTTKPVIVKNHSLVVSRIKRDGTKLVLEEHPVYAEDMNYKFPKLKNLKMERLVLFENIRSSNFEFTDKNGKRKIEIKEDIPQLVKLTVEFTDGEKKEFYFRIMSDYYMKEKIDEEYYESF